MQENYIEQINKCENSNIIFTLHPVKKFYIVLVLVAIDIVLSTITFGELHIPVFLFIYFITILILYMISNVDVNVYKLVGKLACFSGLIFLFQTILVKQGIVVFSCDFFKIYSDGLINGIRIGMNALNISSIFALYFQTTSVENISSALNQLGINYKVSFTILSTFQMIKNINKKVNTIIISQKSRGINIDGNPIQRLKALIPVLFPAFITALIDVENQIMSLESKNFFNSTKKTFIKRVESNNYENIILFSIVSVLLILIVWSLIYGKYL